MNAPLSRFLVEFGGEPVVADAFPELELDLVAEAASVTLTSDEYESRLDEARTEAAATARTEAEIQLKADFEAERTELNDRFQAERDALVQNYGQALSDSLTSAMARLETVLSDALVGALLPVFAQAYQARILEALAETVGTLLADPSRPALRIEGPADLLTAFGDAHGSELALDYVVADQAELTVVADGTRIVTRLSDCLARLQTSEG